MLVQIEQLIKETEQWRDYHRVNRNVIDAAACAIRLTALREALEIIKKNSKSLRTVTFIYIIIKLFFLFLSFYFEFSKELKLFYLIFSNLFLLCIFLYVIYLLYFKKINS